MMPSYILFEISEKKNVTGNPQLERSAYYYIKALMKNISAWMEQPRHGQLMEEEIVLLQSRVALWRETEIGRYIIPYNLCHILINIKLETYFHRQ